MCWSVRVIILKNPGAFLFTGRCSYEAKNYPSLISPISDGLTYFPSDYWLSDYRVHDREEYLYNMFWSVCSPVEPLVQPNWLIYLSGQLSNRLRRFNSHQKVGYLSYQQISQPKRIAAGPKNRHSNRSPKLKISQSCIYSFIHPK